MKERQHDLSSASRLPAEILIKILALNMRGGNASAWYLHLAQSSLVCRKWHGVVQTTPSLFTVCDSWMSDAALSEVLIRSQTLPLEILPSSSKSLYKPFWDVIVKHIKRWRTLTSPISLVLLLALYQGAPVLDMLSIVGIEPGYSIPRDQLQPLNPFAPNLRHLKIEALNLSNVGWSSLPFKGLRTLKLVTLGGVLLAQFFVLLRASPQLVELRLDRCMFTLELLDPPTYKIPLHNLRMLSIKNMSGANRSISQMILENLEAQPCEVLLLIASFNYGQRITEMPSFILESIINIATHRSQLNINIHSDTAVIFTDGLKIEVGPDLALELPHLIDYLNASPSRFITHLRINALNETPSSRETILRAAFALRGMTYFHLRNRKPGENKLILDTLSISAATIFDWPLPNLVGISLNYANVGVDHILAFLHGRYDHINSPSPLKTLVLHTEGGRVIDIPGAEAIVGPGVIQCDPLQGSG